MVYWITGKQGAGKTTLAEKLSTILYCNGWINCVLDGDEIRDNMGDLGYSHEGRVAHISRIVGLARILQRQSIVPIIALVSPLESYRKLGFDCFPDMRLIYVEGGKLWPGTTYEEPKDPWLIYNWRLYLNDFLLEAMVK